MNHVTDVMWATSLQKNLCATSVWTWWCACRLILKPF